MSLGVFSKAKYSPSVKLKAAAELELRRRAVQPRAGGGGGARYWNGHVPTDRQAAFLALDCREAFYGGAAGGGKSDALLMAALQYVHVPGYAAIILRRTYADLALPGALLDRAREWLTGTDARWNAQEKTWTFPSGATLTFGYLEQETQKYRYQSAEFQYIAFDELTQFSKTQYTYLFTRLRKPSNGALAAVPLRMRSASNPGNVGHQWVKQRFIQGWDKRSPIYEREGRTFVFAMLTDNAHIDQDEYRASLHETEPALAAQMETGDWDIAAGQFFAHWSDPIHTCAPFPIPRDWPLWGAFDYGFTHNTAFGVFTRNDGIVYLIGEHIQNKWTVGQHAGAIHALLGRLDATRLSQVVAGHDVFSNRGDSEGKTIADQYRDYGLTFERADIDRINGAAAVLERLGNPDIGQLPTFQVFHTCHATIAQLPAMIHDPNRPEDVLKVDAESDGVGGDDAYDMCRYGLMLAQQFAGAYVTSYAPAARMQRRKR